MLIFIFRREEIYVRMPLLIYYAADSRHDSFVIQLTFLSINFYMH